MERASRQTAEQYLRRGLSNLRANFHDGQWEAIDALVNRNARLLLVQRTGWGKSIVYFLATGCRHEAANLTSDCVGTQPYANYRQPGLSVEIA